MRVTQEGQVTIPLKIREKLGIAPNSEIEFLEENGRIYLVKTLMPAPEENNFRQFRGIATIKMATDEIMRLTRGE